MRDGRFLFQRVRPWPSEWNFHHVPGRYRIDRIGKEHPSLARHFENAMRTGTFCSYQPDRPVRWDV
jgi:hypothetical protein